MGVEIIERERTRSLPSFRQTGDKIFARPPAFPASTKERLLVSRTWLHYRFRWEKDLPLKYVLRRLRTVFTAGSQVMQR